MSQQNQSGIDIRKAIQILAARGSSRDDEKINRHQHQHHTVQDSCGCDCQNSPFSIAQSMQNNATMGQVIDLFGGNSEEDVCSATASSAATAATTPEEEKEMMKKRRQERHVEMQEQLQNMTLTELLQTVLQAQEERVATYRRYDDGLQRVLQSNGNMTQYPTVVAEATASFAVLSDTIRSIRHVLLRDENATTTTTTSQNNKAAVAELLSRLQMAEQNKLHLTAALHLEKIRISAAAAASDDSVNDSTVNGGGDDDPDDTTTTTTKATNSDNDNDKISNLRLYRESIASLQTKIGASVEDINEVLDEIRCIIMDE
jgi:DNA repair REX1-B